MFDVTFNDELRPDRYAIPYEMFENYYQIDYWPFSRHPQPGYVSPIIEFPFTKKEDVIRQLESSCKKLGHPIDIFLFLALSEMEELEPAFISCQRGLRDGEIKCKDGRVRTLAGYNKNYGYYVSVLFLDHVPFCAIRQREVPDNRRQIKYFADFKQKNWQDDYFLQKEFDARHKPSDWNGGLVEFNSRDDAGRRLVDFVRPLIADGTLTSWKEQLGLLGSCAK